MKRQDQDTQQDNKGLIGAITGTEGITRKQAIKRMGKYAAITALGSYLILHPQKAQAQSPGVDNSPPDTGGNPFLED
jgi:hypothetical protein